MRLQTVPLNFDVCFNLLYQAAARAIEKQAGIVKPALSMAFIEHYLAHEGRLYEV